MRTGRVDAVTKVFKIKLVDATKAMGGNISRQLQHQLLDSGATAAGATIHLKDLNKSTQDFVRWTRKTATFMEVSARSEAAHIR